MTILGKMMAIFVLVLSLVQGALVVMLFVSRSNWVAQNKLLAAQATAASTSAGEFQNELERVRAEAKNEKAALEARLKTADQAQKDLMALNADLDKKVSDEKEKVNAAESTSRQAIIDAKTRQADNERMLAVVNERDKQIVTLVTDNKKEREDRLNAEIAMKTAIQRSVEMEAKLKDAMREIVKQRNQSSGTVTTTSAKNAPNPPAENVEGLVAEAGSDGLGKITIGSDAGLREGNTLEAYRIATVPSQSQYLGMVRVRTVKPNEAVVEPVGRMSAPLQRGDHVSSRILGAS